MAERVYGDMAVTAKDDPTLEVKGAKIGTTLSAVRDFAESVAITDVLGVPEKVFFELVENPEYQALDFRPTDLLHAHSPLRFACFIDEFANESYLASTAPPEAMSALISSSPIPASDRISRVC